VRSSAEKQEAVRAVWLAPGVTGVDDQLVITS
jgi:osmotically-inducible protein OsmY